MSSTVDYSRTMSPRVRPLDAARALRALMRDKDDATNVVLFRAALDGDWYGPFYRRFIADPAGRRLQARGVQIFDYLSDFDYLSSLPEGSLGKIFHDELIRDGVTLEGFREVDRGAQDFTQLPEEWRYSHQRRIDMHDLMHTVTGWRRDVLGEICMVCFQAVHWRSRGFHALCRVGGLELKRRYWRLPVFRCVREARLISERMKPVVTFNWEAYLDRPIQEARAAVNWSPPTTYWAALEDALDVDRREREKIKRRKVELSARTICERSICAR